MLLAVVVCIAAFIALIWISRASSVSLGLPIAYLASLLLIHVPGAIAYLLDADGILPFRGFTQIGIWFTAIGAVCFVIGVGLNHWKTVPPVPVATNRTLFNRFCLLGGWLVTTVASIIAIPSIGAALQRGGAVWMLGIILALKSALRSKDWAMGGRWLIALTVYPILMLLLGGFLSYGVAAVVIVLSAVTVPVRSKVRLAGGIVLASVLGISVFLSYFEHRSEIRGAVWGGASVDTRINASMGAVKDIGIFSARNPGHLHALDDRLNQNYFVGLAASRIEAGSVDYLKGRSLWEGALALVPRALWPDKPVVAGSPKIVAEMTGLSLSRGTSFGVGNVMEFQINFGIPGLIVGFLLFGFILGRLDRLAASADLTGDFGRTFFYFLPAVALIQPNGSIVEMMSGAAAAFAAAFAWRWVWLRWPKPTSQPAFRIRSGPLPQSL
jgi:hypothetical protein